MLVPKLMVSCTPSKALAPVSRGQAKPRAQTEQEADQGTVSRACWAKHVHRPEAAKCRTPARLAERACFTTKGDSEPEMAAATAAPS